VIDLRARAQRHNELVERRLDELVPRLLHETGIDCWLLIGREYAEDPVLATMLPAEWLSARRRTILVLTPDDRFAVARYPVGSLFRSEWDPSAEPDQWARLARILSDMDPATIGIGTSAHQAHADGLTVTEHDRLLDALPPHLGNRLVSAGTLGIRWLETRLPEERSLLEDAATSSHGILRRGLSREVIDPGTTTTDDVAWWLRQAVHEAGFSSWFHPSVSTQRAGADTPPGGFAGAPRSTIIEPGDLVHVDFGIVDHGLCTDQQEHAYVLYPGEQEAPKGLADGLLAANRAQDILMSTFLSGRSGNDILAAARDATASEGLVATIYTHSIGVHGHGAGMAIGLWDRQDAVPGPGDHPMHPDTAYSIELMVEHPVAEWGGKVVRFMVEQDAWFDGETCAWLDGRQDELWLI
jgi:Xaa-Pro aminopeptidase